MSKPVKKRGRPAKFKGERTRGSLTIRLRDRVREDLEGAAAASQRSLSEEVEYRLELSLSHRDYLEEQWGRDVYALAQSLAQSLWHIERFTGKRWVEDDETDETFRRTADQLFRNYRALVLREPGETPFGHIEDMSPEDRAKAFASAGGISPPRARSDIPHGLLEAERKQSLEDWRRWMSRKPGDGK